MLTLWAKLKFSPSLASRPWHIRQVSPLPASACAFSPAAATGNSPSELCILICRASLASPCPALPPQAIAITSPHPNQSCSFAIAPKLFSTETSRGAALTFPSEAIAAPRPSRCFTQGYSRGVPAAAQPAAGDGGRREGRCSESGPGAAELVRHRHLVLRAGPGTQPPAPPEIDFNKHCKYT